MKRVSRYFCTYKKEYATVTQHGPSYVVRTKQRERVIETPACPDLVLGGNIEVADSADTPFLALCKQYGMGGQA